MSLHCTCSLQPCYILQAICTLNNTVILELSVKPCIQFNKIEGPSHNIERHKFTTTTILDTSYQNTITSRVTSHQNTNKSQLFVPSASLLILWRRLHFRRVTTIIGSNRREISWKLLRILNRSACEVRRKDYFCCLMGFGIARWWG